MPPLKGVDGLRSHRRGRARMALIGVNLNELSSVELARPL